MAKIKCQTRCTTFLPTMYVKNRPDIVAKPIADVPVDFVSKFHRRKATPLSPVASAFIDIMKNDIVPYFKALDL